MIKDISKSIFLISIGLLASSPLFVSANQVNEVLDVKKLSSLQDMTTMPSMHFLFNNPATNALNGMVKVYKEEYLKSNAENFYVRIYNAKDSNYGSCDWSSTIKVDGTVVPVKISLYFSQDNEDTNYFRANFTTKTIDNGILTLPEATYSNYYCVDVRGNYIADNDTSTFHQRMSPMWTTPLLIINSPFNPTWIIVSSVLGLVVLLLVGNQTRLYLNDEKSRDMRKALNKYDPFKDGDYDNFKSAKRKEIKNKYKFKK